MAKKPSKKSIEKDKTSVQTNIEVGGNVGGNIIVGEGNTINITPEQQVFRSLHQLPPPPADFTGREDIIEELLNDFESHKGATITGLTGMGGIGKTVLGLAVAQQIAENYPDAQIFLDLKGTTTPLSATDIMRHVILSFEPTADLNALDETNMSAAYQSVLNSRKILLFLDNARSDEQITPLRPPETCALLATSRWNFAVAGLKTHKVGVLQEEEAISFLLELCPRIDKKAAELAKICGFLPLALRIAGSFLSVNTHWKVEKYLDELKSAKGRLETFAKSREGAGLSAEPDVLATFELSYNQLKDDEKKNWRALGAFPASFFENTAATVWEMGEEDANNLLALLLRYSLIDFNETSTRYELHDVLAEYARNQMENREEQLVRLKHASHYMNVMRTTDLLYKMGNENILQGLRLFDLEWEHIRFAHTWITNNISQSEHVAELAMWYPDASIYCLDLRLSPTQKIDWLNFAIIASRKLERKEISAAHLGNLGKAYIDLGDARRAIEFYEQALSIARDIGDRQNEGAVLGCLGSAQAVLGDVYKAIEFYEQSLVIVREIGDKNAEAKLLMNLGQVYLREGYDDKKAEWLFQQSLTKHEQIGDMRGKAYSLMSLGMLAYVQNRDGEAREYYRQAQDLATHIEAKPLDAGIKLFCAPLDGIVFGKDEAIRLANDAKQAFAEMGMNVLDKEMFSQLLEMFAGGQFPK